MPAAFIYLLKLSVCLGIVFLFYHLVLRKLTFYNWNRWYLLGYSILSFIIPIIDISSALHQNELADSDMVQWIPILYLKKSAATSLTVWKLLFLLIIIGMMIMFFRLIIQLLSFRRMKKKAQLISDEDINIYQVNETIIPFSFGNAVFINRHLHSDKELAEIMRHEFVHVKQRHFIDIIFGELLCLLNWYNPFAWLIKSSIRQNLEFIADNKVLKNGINKKHYQYLLLKVIGNNQYSIAQKFNFSSLKKRIAMMNKNKSAKLHLLRFLFLLPVLAFILISFRKEIGNTFTAKENQLHLLSIANASDTIPQGIRPNSKGYLVTVNESKGENKVVITDKEGKEVKTVLLSEWNSNAQKYESLYGKIPLPLPPAPPVASELAIASVSPLSPPNADAPIPPAPPVPMELPENIQSVNISNGKVTISLKKGQKEYFDLNKADQKAKFENKYGELVPPPLPAKNNEAPVAAINIQGKVEPADASLHGPANPYNTKTGFVKGVPENVIYILDGVEINKAEADNLDPEKIESMNVLKGNAAITLYGEKGANGVIIIKTKNNEKRKTTTLVPYLFQIFKNDGC